MSDSELFEIPPAPANPVEFAATVRTEPIIETVRRAINNRHVMLAYQPVVYSNDVGKTAYFEGLIRVLDQFQEVVEAKHFMPLVESLEIGRILDCHALRLGLQALQSEPTLRLAINMSARSIGYPAWINTLRKGMEADETVAQRLILEITEESGMTVPELVASFMADLLRYGISFALDDFGSGHTAFRYFRDFQFDIVKLDGQFIRKISEDADNQVLTSALLDIAKHFDMFTVAEQVESEDELEYLKKAGVDCVQGFHLGLPQIVPEWTAPLYRDVIAG